MSLSPNLLPNEPIIETERLKLRNWCEDDLDLFYEINSDEDVMEFFPFRRTRTQCAELMEKFQKDIAKNKYGWFVIALKENDRPLGFCGIIDVPEHMAALPEVRNPTLEIGWRLAKSNWGKGYVTEAAHAVLDYAFTKLKQEIIVSYAVKSNHRSLAVMDRIGLTYIKDNDFDYPDEFAASHPHLMRCVYYEITRDEWQAKQTTSA